MCPIRSFVSSSTVCTRVVDCMLFFRPPAQGPVRGVRRERQTDLLVHVHPPVRQLPAMRARPVLWMGQTDQDLQTLPTRVSRQTTLPIMCVYLTVVIACLQTPAGRDQLVAERVRELGGQQEADRDVWPERASQLFR